MAVGLLTAGRWLPVARLAAECRPAAALKPCALAEPSQSWDRSDIRCLSGGLEGQAQAQPCCPPQVHQALAFGGVPGISTALVRAAPMGIWDGDRWRCW